MTYENVLLTLIFLAILFLAPEILALIRKQRPHSRFKTEFCDFAVLFRVQTVLEGEFEIGYVDDWSVGRSFSVHGAVLPISGNSDDMPDFGKRTGLYVYPSADWFQDSRLGTVRTFERGGCESRVVLPYQLARQLLEDLRHEPDQIVRIGFKKSVNGKGEVIYPIYSIELSEPLE